MLSSKSRAFWLKMLTKLVSKVCFGSIIRLKFVLFFISVGRFPWQETIRDFIWDKVGLKAGSPELQSSVKSAKPAQSSKMGPLILINNRGKQTNLCFVNASLQALYCLPEFRDILKDFGRMSPIACEIKEIFKSEGGKPESANKLRK